MVEKHVAGDEGKILATPAVRALAGDMKVDLKKVKATGKGGRITKDDVVKFAESLKKAPETPAPISEQAKKPSPPKAPQKLPEALGKDTIITLEGERKVFCKKMSEALTVPHYNMQDEVSIERIKKIQKSYADLYPGKKMTLLPFFVKAFSQAMIEFPVFNALASPARDSNGYIVEYIEKAEHNIGIAVDTPHGLLVPNIKSVQKKSIFEINEISKALIEKARNGTLDPEDTEGTTFTFSNLGSVGGMAGAPLVFKPQVAIGATGYVRKTVDFIKKANGEMTYAPKEYLSVSISCDHRIVDGATGARFITRVKQFIENIDSLLLSLK